MVDGHGGEEVDVLIRITTRRATLIDDVQVLLVIKIDPPVLATDCCAPLTLFTLTALVSPPLTASHVFFHTLRLPRE